MSERKLGLNKKVRAELDAMLERSGEPMVVFVGMPAHGENSVRADWLRRGEAIAEYMTEHTDVEYEFVPERKIVKPV